MNRSKWRIALGALATIALVGCGGGSPHNDDETTGSSRLSSLSGMLGDTSKSGRALLKLDTNDNGRFDDKGDLSLAVTVENGTFVFNGVATPKDKVLHGQLIVTMNGYAPFQRVVALDGSSLSIDASAALNKPALKAAVNLGGLSPAARMGSVVQFGIQKGANGMQAFSRLVSLSQLAAEEANGTTIPGMVSTYQFGADAFEGNVSLLQAEMQAFDSTNSQDIQNFPGSFRGYGQNGAKSAADGEVGLASAAFDRFVLTDQNGQDVTLKSNKLNATVDLSTCTNRWTRHLTSGQEAVIEGWGDYDSTDPGFQVPIWSNDNSEMAWKFVGVANYDSSNHQFEMCIPDDWGSGYLNCDSPIAFEKPVNICFNATDQNNNPVTGLSISGQTNPSGSYIWVTTDTQGHASDALADTNISKWDFSYSGSITGWNHVAITANPVEVNTDACNYELNITGINNPYTAEVKVTAYKKDGTTPADSAYVRLDNDSYGYRNLHLNGTTDAQGVVTFMVEPNVDYVVSYGGATAAVNVNHSVVSPETADSGAYADVSITEANTPPSGFIYLTMQTVNKDFTSSIPVEISGWDGNGDSLTLSDLKVDGTAVTLSGSPATTTAGSLWQYGDLDISTLSIGQHTLTAILSDGEVDTGLSGTFEVTGNRAPFIAAPLVVSVSQTEFFNIEESGTILKPNANGYLFENANVYDPDGDPFTVSIAVDGAVPGYVPQILALGEHNATVTASDSNHTVSKSFIFTVANQKPVITRAGTFSNPINLSLGDRGTLYAYAADPDGDGIDSVVATSGSMSQTLTADSSETYFWLDFNASELGTGSHTITFVATDGTAQQSEEFNVTVTVINQNMPPEFYLPLYDQQIKLGDPANYPEIAIMDPEGDRMTLACTVDGTSQALSASATGMADSYQMSITGLTEGTHAVECIATDAEGASTTETATITVIDPTKEVALTIKTSVPGLIVTAHDAGNGLKMIKSGTTDANGDVTLMLPAGTTTTSFSLSMDPSTVVSSTMVFRDKKGEVLTEAAENCRWDRDLNISQCATADWCSLLADEDSIPTWTVDAAKLKDKDDVNITGASVDTDNNGEISIAEFYQAALRIADKDNSGDLTSAELDDGELMIRAFVNVPVKTYTFDFSAEEDHGQMYGEGGLNCSQYPTFTIRVTQAASGPVDRLDIYGSGYGCGYGNDTDTIEANVTAYQKDKNGKYDYSVQFFDSNYQLVGMDLLLDKSATDLNTGKTYDASALPTPATRDVNITNDVPHGYLSVTGEYQGIRNMGYQHSIGNSMSRIFYDSRLHYVIDGSMYLGTSSIQKSYQQHDYYGDGTLKPSYKASDYPMLDLDVNTSTGTAIFSGTDKNKVDVSTLVLEGFTRDANGYYQDNDYSIQIIKFADQTTDFNLDDLDVSEMFPDGFATTVEDTMDQSTDETIRIIAQEYKGKSASDILDMQVSGDYLNQQTLPQRSFYYSTTMQSGGGTSAP